VIILKGTKKSKAKQKFSDEFRHILNYIPEAIKRNEILRPEKIRLYFEIYAKFKKSHRIHTLQKEFRDIKNKLINYLINILGLPSRRSTVDDVGDRSIFKRSIVICLDKGIYIAFHVTGDEFNNRKDQQHHLLPFIVNKMAIVDFLNKIISQGITDVAAYHERYDKPKDEFNDYAKMMQERIEKAAAAATAYVKAKKETESALKI